jgi:alpha-L-fucosidase
MKPSLSLLGIFLCCSLGLFTMAQPKAPSPFGALPTARQLAWQETDMYVLIHFTPTTFENKEWGYGDADPAVFNPSDFSADQIVGAAKAGGFKGVIFVSKHHDGFCLWPTATTPYNISKSPWKQGKGDMVGEFARACRTQGMKFGVYCSPWDRNNPAYGTYDYIKTYRAQLKELYTRYGDLFMSWHDGANGGDGYYGGTREKRTTDLSTYYGWDTTWSTLTRKLQPGAAIFSDAGWDVRWVGNEAGEAAETSWATFSPKPAEGKTKVGPGMIDYKESPYGTRNGKEWMPAECDVPLRDGWFYHADQDGKVKDPETLFKLYLRSVGRGACLDLGLSPDKRGRLHDNDVAALKGFGELLNRTFSHDLAREAVITPSEVRGNDARTYSVAHLTDGDRYSHWATDDKAREADLVFEWKQAVDLNLLRIREDIRLGQRVTSVQVDGWVDGQWKLLAKATSVGACRLILLDRPTTTKKIRVHLSSLDACPVISEVGMFLKK